MFHAIFIDFQMIACFVIFINEGCEPLFPKCLADLHHVFSSCSGKANCKQMRIELERSGLVISSHEEIKHHRRKPNGKKNDPLTHRLA